MTGTELAALLEAQPFRTATETMLQDDIAAFLKSVGWGRLGIPFEREYRLSEKDRVDFLVGGIACEVKIHDPIGKVTRQLHRYAQHDEVTALVLVTTRLQLARVPTSLNGKTVSVAALVRGL